MTDFSMKPEYFQGKKEQRKKTLNIASDVMSAMVVLTSLTLLTLFFLNLFQKKPYCFSAIFVSFVNAVITLYIVILVVKIIHNFIFYVKEEKKKKFLPLSTEEMKKEKINTPYEYSTWLNKYLNKASNKRLSDVQLETLKKYHVLYLRWEDSYISEKEYDNKVFFKEENEND